MAEDRLSLGSFDFQRQDEVIVLKTPAGSSKTKLTGFLNGIQHLLRMEFDLEGSAEMDGGFFFRAQGEQVKLSLDGYSETFAAGEVEALFEQMAQEWST